MKKVYENSFPKIGPFSLFPKGLNSQIVENKEIYRNLYKNCRVKLL